MTSRNGVEVADIFRQHISRYRKQYKMPIGHLRVASSILNCRTAFLGGHIEQCDHCGTTTNAYNSCRNRHCPKCQCLTKERWLEARKAELLPVRYFHVVFTLPHILNPVILTNKRIMLNFLFMAVAGTLMQFGLNPKGLGGRLGIIAILHTWDQRLRDHFHLHCLVPAGALCDDKKRWHHCKTDFLFHVKALSVVFREKYMGYVKAAFRDKDLIFPGQTKILGTPKGFKQLIDRCYTHKWVVDIRKPIDKPEYVLDYLGRYTHRVAISNNRILSLTNGLVRFACKDRKTGQVVTEEIDAVEFIRRFLLHVLPRRFMRIRHFGFLANRNKKANVLACRQLLGITSEFPQTVKESIQQMMLRLTGHDILRCPKCQKGNKVKVARIPKWMGPSAYDLLRPP